VDAATRDLFDANAATYDRVNTIVSLGLDARWRDWAARSAGARAGARVLDAFAGTGLVGLRAAALGADVTLADGSEGMLAVARRRAEASGRDIRVAVTDLEADPPLVPGAPFDAVTMVFGVRYLEDPVRVVRGLASLLKPGGTFVIVEFVEPGRGLLSRLAAAYFFRVLPRLAGALAGRRGLYDRLAATTHAMGPAGRLAAIARGAGLRVTQTRSMGFGLVAGVVARADPPHGEAATA
jgi:demethylmenaquinone methyltransferase / 2-methoxy-6-polyprenyl-1,4-benzoquinol methylase